MAALKPLFLVVSLLCFIIVSSQQRQQRRLFNAAQTKFSAFNNGYYQYQYQHSCDCDICNTQSMNINVENNTASNIVFTEGNNHALTEYCSNNDAVLEAISDTKLTVNDIFTLIQESISNDIDITVTYHEDIGIPLSIIMDSNDEDTIVIHCIIFDALHASPLAVDQTQSSNNRNNRNRNSETVSIKDFNSDDPYSCSNVLDIDITATFEVCISHCAQHKDGCLSCECGDKGEVLVPCALEYDEDCSLNDKTCSLCEDPETMYYTECGTADITCANRDIWLKTTEIECIKKCQCKDEFPIYDPTQKKCITPDECTDDEVVKRDFGRCVEHCPVYYDGCNACHCPHIGSGLGDKSDDFCSNLADCLGFVGGSRRMCFRCEIPEMEYVVCGSCDRTCADPNPSCLQSDDCLEKCQCPLYAPIYDNGRCITFEQCADIEVNELRKNAKVADENALKTETLIADNVQKSNHVMWEDVLVYIIIGVICIVAGVSLLFWPCLCMKNRIRGSNMSEDQLRADVGPALSYLPDGTVLNPARMVITLDSGLSGNNSGRLP